MLGLIMAGGKGSRMDMPTEKLLLKFRNKPIIQHVVESMMKSDIIEEIVATTSSDAPATEQFLCGMNAVRVIHTPGSGYSADLGFALHNIPNKESRVLVIPGDTPLLDVSLLQSIARRCDVSFRWNTILVSNTLLQKTFDHHHTRTGYTEHIDGKTCHYTGISIVDQKKADGGNTPVTTNHIVLDDEKLAYNLNTRADYDALLSLGYI